MPNFNQIADIPSALETKLTAEKENQNQKMPNKSAADYAALALTTFGVGYLPLAPGTWGSIVGVLIYLIIGRFEKDSNIISFASGWTPEQIAACLHAFNLISFVVFCAAGIWAASRAIRIFGNKDPQQAVIDEVIGQLTVFMFIPFTASWFYVGAGFLLFRLFDIWKPYPINLLENLPGGIGICADDLLAGIYAGISFL